MGESEVQSAGIRLGAYEAQRLTRPGTPTPSRTASTPQPSRPQQPSTPADSHAGPGAAGSTAAHHAAATAGAPEVHDHGAGASSIQQPQAWQGQAQVHTEPPMSFPMSSSRTGSTGGGGLWPGMLAYGPERVQRSVVKIKKCRFLEAAGCTAVVSRCI